MKVALDTNVLVYAEGVNGASMKTAALKLVQSLPLGSVLVPVQALGELFSVLVRKAGRSPENACTAILSWADAFALIDSSATIMLGAADLAKSHKLNIWDAVILHASATAGCRLLLSEDLQDGFTWVGVTVTNPFKRTRHPLLEALLKRDGV